MILVVLIFAAFGAMLRYPARESRRPWLVTAILAGAGAAVWLLSFLMEVDGTVMALLFLACAAGSASCGLFLRRKASEKPSEK
ncbi:MAG: hypothetical protein LKJ80_04370 [Oscillibacter sp.]|jgi:hypothetical protein|nr:hypothetical protein [Oscillibacter sp.]